jgi:RHS repeat-associated protein
MILTTSRRPRGASRLRRRVCASEKRSTGFFRARTGHRFYNSNSGRWLNRDPKGEGGGVNIYVFVNNDGVGKVDKLGEVPWAPEPPPSNAVTPQGPFPSCKIAVKCTWATAFGIPIPFKHCGLVIDTGNGVYEMHGTGGTINTQFMIPSSTSAATGPWTSQNPQVCACLVNRMATWNQLNVPRNNMCENSNWTLKCGLNKCSANVNWGSQSKPRGFNCRKCLRWSNPSSPIGAPTGSGGGCCTLYGPSPCPA